MNNLECPHCKKDDIKYSATVCSGCHSEIIYGNTFSSFLAWFLFLPAIGFFLTISYVPQEYIKMLVKLTSDGVAAAIIFIVYLIPLWKVNRLLFKKRILFRRKKNA